HQHAGLTPNARVCLHVETFLFHKKGFFLLEIRHQEPEAIYFKKDAEKRHAWKEFLLDEGGYAE
ncbi:hypothetical protein, partial [Bacillus altitudinis]|uniref:hypothetical protein n=1 Tax=Bacillus altitudinis TaxID=293387 RepID=UPI002280EB39